MSGFYETYVDLHSTLGDEWLDDYDAHQMLNVIYSPGAGFGDYRAAAFDDLQYHMMHEYGMDFFDWFDWDDYRSWYDAA